MPNNPVTTAALAESLQMVKKLVKHLDKQTGRAFNYDLSEEAWALLGRLDPTAELAPRTEAVPGSPFFLSTKVVKAA